MNTFKAVYMAMEEAAARLGWTLAVADQSQDEPEQWRLVVTKEDPAQALFKTLGVHVEDGIKSRDVFGGDNG